jgi:hypothetical protein
MLSPTVQLLGDLSCFTAVLLFVACGSYRVRTHVHVNVVVGVGEWLGVRARVCVHTGAFPQSYVKIRLAHHVK